jgi:peroxiredoxin (alkyl hydroperoxide reductase subunit C)
MLTIGDKAPKFRAVTTQGEINFPDDYKGKWVILFSHPADFTPACISDFITFVKREPEFSALNCQLAGLSIESLSNQITWVRAVKKDKVEFEDAEITFPLIGDITAKIAKKYGMIQLGESSTKVVRAISLIDPKGIVRALIYYPLSMNRNFDELKWGLSAMQTADACAWLKQ